MKSFSTRRAFTAMLCALFLTGCGVVEAESQVKPLPDAAMDVPAAGQTRQTAVFAGGCFWGVEAVFRSVNGVISATSGYAGGSAKTADYRSVGTGSTGHAEAVQVVFDPTKVTYAQLLKVLFAVAHDPTQLNRQGPDTGTQYRSAIFTTSPDQERVAKAYIAQLEAAKVYSKTIVTQVTPLTIAAAFYPAEAYHQNYLALHPNEPYIVINDAPKLVALKNTFPALYRKPI